MTNIPGFSDRTELYEILFRFGDGALQGAHAQYRRIVAYGGEILKDEVQPPVPVALEGLAASGAMTEATAAALAEVARLRAENEALRAALAAQAHPEPQSKPQT